MSHIISRRAILAGGASLLAASSPLRWVRAVAPQAPKGPFTLPALPYAFDALEPHIDAKTMEIHHDRHHAAYVNNLNTALKDHADLQSLSIEALLGKLKTLPESIQTAVRNNGGGHYNHSLFWKTMKPGGGGKPTGALADAIESQLGGFNAFKESLTKAATTRFGSGWAWLYQTPAGKLAVGSTPNQDSPLFDGATPLLGIDVWEHAYYLKYQNKRADYITAWWSTINWDEVAKRFKA